METYSVKLTQDVYFYIKEQMLLSEKAGKPLRSISEYLRGRLIG